MCRAVVVCKGANWWRDFRQLRAVNARTEVVCITFGVLQFIGLNIMRGHVTFLLIKVIDVLSAQEAVLAIVQVLVRLLMRLFIAFRANIRAFAWNGRSLLTCGAARFKLIIEVKVARAAAPGASPARDLPSAMPRPHHLSLCCDILVVIRVSSLILDGGDGFFSFFTEVLENATLVLRFLFTITMTCRMRKAMMLAPLCDRTTIVEGLVEAVAVNLSADLIALLVHLLPVLVEAILSATLGNQLLFCWCLNQHIHIALNLLSGRPVNLSIPLEALLLRVSRMLVFLTLGPTFLVRILTVQVVARVILAVFRLAFCLLAITAGIVLDVCVVG